MKRCKQIPAHVQGEKTAGISGPYADTLDTKESLCDKTARQIQAIIENECLSDHECLMQIVQIISYLYDDDHKESGI